MPTYERRTRIDAPLEEVWQFHSRIEALEAVTPDWMGMRVESVIGPDGHLNPERLEVGAEISLSIHPFGMGPRQYTTSLIVARETSDGVAFFRDEMIRGPFDHWLHTHAFYADGAQTVLQDHVEYELPAASRLGRLRDVVPPVSWLGFEVMFRARHRETSAHLG